ncbi:hypothetical protein GCM10023063_04560 [Arthrobacter methylotrophus]|uniref:MFS transporter n=1 Tax=Arthrobacter methylotrophus TaxID=121291 RepID=A0ABV5USS7_9MICC
MFVLSSLLRDFGFALGPVIVGAIALSSAGSQLIPVLQSSGLPVDQLDPALGIAKAGGPIALNSLPEGVRGSAAHDFAMQALGSGFQLAYVVVAMAALAAALISIFGLHAVRDAEDPEVAVPEMA